MDLLTVVLLAVGLSFDSFAVSVSSGLILKKIEFLPATRIAFSLAFFQAAMPVIGWLVGLSIKDYIREFDHWIAFVMLLLIGLKMIWESFHQKEKPADFNPLNIYVLVTLSIATSIDALIVGVGFGFSEVRILEAIVIIGTVTFIISMLGILFGKKAGNRFGKRMEVAGGMILIGIGVKILVTHLYFQPLSH